MKSSKHVYVIVYSAAFLVAATGCANKKEHSYQITIPVSAVVKSEKEAQFYRNPKMALYSYNKIILEPLSVTVDSASSAQGLILQDISTLRLKFYTAMKEALKEKYIFVNEAGAGVLRMQVSILDVKPSVSLSGLNPATSLKSTLDIEQATIEAKFIDSQTGEVLITLSDPGFQSKVSAVKSISQWRDIENLFKPWAIILSQTLDHSNAPAKVEQVAQGQ